jgi:hypothetical protein
VVSELNAAPKLSDAAKSAKRHFDEDILTDIANDNYAHGYVAKKEMIVPEKERVLLRRPSMTVHYDDHYGEGRHAHQDVR